MQFLVLAENLRFSCFSEKTYFLVLAGKLCFSGFGDKMFFFAVLSRK